MARSRFLAVAGAAITLVLLFYVYRSRQIAESASLNFRPTHRVQFSAGERHPKDPRTSTSLYPSAVIRDPAADDADARASDYAGSGAQGHRQLTAEVEGLALVQLEDGSTGQMARDEMMHGHHGNTAAQEPLGSHGQVKSHDHPITDANTNTNDEFTQAEPTYTYEEILREEQDTVEADRRELEITQQKQEEVAAKLAAEREKFLEELALIQNSTHQQLEEMKHTFDEARKGDELKLLEERQLLEAERRRLEEDKKRFEGQLRQLRELSNASLLLDGPTSTEAPHVPPEYWEGLTWEDVHSRFPDILLLSDYKPRNFFGESGSVRASQASELASLLDTQAEDRFYNLVSMNHIACQQIQRMGNTGDGGWDLCVAKPYKPERGSCIVYSFGINNDFSFDDDMAEKFACEVLSFDPSMSTGDHLHAPHVHFYQLGLGPANGVNAEGWKLLTLSKIMEKLGHTESTIDVVKMDIEFNEWDCLLTMLSSGVLHRVKQFIFEIHTSEMYLISRPSSKNDYFVMHSTLFKLEQHGFRRYHYHFNPFGKFTSIRSGKQRTCCYELYYVNIHYMKADHQPVLDSSS